MVLSTLATSTPAEVAAAAPTGRRWFQLYCFRDAGVTRALIDQARDAGFEALVLTVDAPRLAPPRARPAHRLPDSRRHHGAELRRGDGRRDRRHAGGHVRRDGRHAHLAGPRAARRRRGSAGARQGSDHRGGCPPRVRARRGRDRRLQPRRHASSTARRRRSTRYPRSSMRFAEGSKSSSTAGSVAARMWSRRSRSARNAVLAGRAVLWGLAAEGEPGARRVLELLRDEIELALVLTGCDSVSALTRAHVSRAAR